MNATNPSQSRAKTSSAPPAPTVVSKSASTRSPVGNSMTRETYGLEQEEQLIKELRTIIREQVPGYEQDGSRTSWLSGLQSANFTRYPGNALTDLNEILHEVAGIGRLGDGRWPISIFIGNVKEAVKGYQCERDLEALHDRLVGLFEQREGLKRGITKNPYGVGPNKIEEQKQTERRYNAKEPRSSVTMPLSEYRKLVDKSQKQAMILRPVPRETKDRLSRIIDFLKTALNAADAIEQRIANYEQSNQYIEPLLKLANLLEHYRDLCLLCEPKCPTQEVLKTMRSRVEPLTRGDDGKFLRWIELWASSDQVSQMALAHDARYGKVKRNATTLLRELEKLTESDDSRRLHKSLGDLEHSFREELASWTEARTTLRQDIDDRLGQLKTDMAKHTGVEESTQSDEKEG